MAHNIHIDATGKECMFVVGKREDAWHLLGQRTDSAATWEQALELAGLNWEIIKNQNYARSGNQRESPVVPVDSYSIFRSTDNVCLASNLGAGYVVKQNRDCFKFVDTLLEANGGAHYDSAGALGNGAKIWCAVRLPSADFSIGFDKHEAYLLFTTAHDGSMAHTVKLTHVRVVCQNTLNMALRSADGEAMFRVKHTKNAEIRMDRAKDLMTGVKQDAQALQLKLTQLANRKMTRETMIAVINRLFPAPKEENANTTRRENVITEVLGLYANADGNAFPEQRGTAFNMLNAVTEYADHFRTARQTADRAGQSLQTLRAENAVVGSGDKLKLSALAVIDEITTDTSNTADAIINPMDDAQFLKEMGISL